MRTLSRWRGALTLTFTALLLGLGLAMPETVDAEPRRARSQARRRAAPARTATARRARRAKQRRQTVRYRAALKRWQTLGAGVRTSWREGMRDVVFHAVNTGETVVVRPYRADGSLDLVEAGSLRQVLRDHRAGVDHPVDPRLVSVLYRLVVELDAPQVNVISGFRQPRGRGHSQHGDGKAVDLVIPGVEQERVAEVARRFGRVGVGVYPTSGFVHVDVRDRSFFWIDRSGPGQRGRVVQVRAAEARAADAAYDPARDRIGPIAQPPTTVAALAPDLPERPRARARHRRASRRARLRAGHR